MPGPGDLRGHLRRAEVEAAGPRRGGADERRDPVAIVGVRRADEAALAARDERGGERGVAVVRRRRSTTGPKTSCSWSGAHVIGVWRRADDRADEVALAGGRRRPASTSPVPPSTALGRGGEARDAVAHVAQLLRGRERAHADVLARRIADGDRRRAARAARRTTSATRAAGHEHAADRGALLAGLLRHVAHDVGEEQRAGLAARARRRGRGPPR